MPARVRTALMLLWLPCALAAQGAEDMAGMRSAYAAWLVREDVRGTGVFAYAGVPKTAVGDATRPVDLGGVSASVTALCVAGLVDTGRLDFSESLRDILGRGPDVSVASLITHSSGLVEDITGPLMAGWLNAPDDRAGIVLDLVSVPTGMQGVHVHNDVNYALLSLVIEARGQGRYEDICRRLVLDPVGVRGAGSARMGAAIAWAGWAMSPYDYARLHAHWFGPGTRSGRAPFDYPHVPLGNDDAFYGLGTIFRARAERFDFWQFGGACFPGLFSFGTYAVTWGGAWTVMLAHDGCVDDTARRALDGAMAQAARAGR